MLNRAIKIRSQCVKGLLEYRLVIRYAIYVLGWMSAMVYRLLALSQEQKRPAEARRALMIRTYPFQALSSWVFPGIATGGTGMVAPYDVSGGIKTVLLFKTWANESS